MVAIHPASSPEHLPFWFRTGPGQTDVLMLVMGVVLVLFVLLFGVVFLRLHHLPEHIAQKQQKIQYQIVAVLSLIAMLTHENVLWIAALLLAMIDLPDFTGLFDRIAHSVERVSVTRRFRSGARSSRKGP
jgi:hypothetical protein